MTRNMPGMALEKFWLAVAILFCLTVSAAAAVRTSPANFHATRTAQAAPTTQVAPPTQAGPAVPAPVPPSEIDASRKLDQSAEALKQIETVLQNQDISQKDLQALRDKSTALADELRATLGWLNARWTAAKARLDQLGPPPDAKAAPENPQVTQDRQAQQKDYEAVDALVKRDKLLLVQTEQISARTVERQRAKFTHSLFERAPSIANSTLWVDLFAETPHNLKMVRAAFGDWIGTSNKRLATAWRTQVFWALILAVLVLYWPLSIVAQRVLARESDAKPSRLRKIFAAIWAVFVIAGSPALGFLAISGTLIGFDLFDAPIQDVLYALFSAIFSVALAAGLARGLLAPQHPNWRLIKLGNESSRHAHAAIIIFSALIAVSHFTTYLGTAIGSDWIYQSALRGIGALLVALAIMAALWRAQGEDCDSEAIFGPRVTATHDWFGLLRILLWIAAVTIIVAVTTGFMGLASFLADQIYWIGTVGGVATLSLILVEEAIAAGCRPTAPFGRALMATTGLHRDSVEQIAILLSGATRVAIFVAAVLLVLAPWGIQSTDLPTYFRTAFFGFHVGDITISLSSVGIAVGILIAGTMATRAVERWLEVSFLPHTRLDVGLRNAIKTSFGYLGFILALGFALAYLGLSFDKLAIVAGALSLGIGFGLQSIVNNFVSGLILLWERAIRVGDWIVVGGEEGLVRRINVRSTEIETFDRVAVIVPNSNLIAGVVKNYVRTDRSGRVHITIPVNPAADPELARDILLQIANGHQLVLKEPAPAVIFSGITATAYNFELYSFVADVATLGTVKSELNFEIYRRFKSEGLFAAPPPISVVTLAGLEKFEPLLDKIMAADARDGLGNKKPSD